jgi:hypothetical protein
MADRAVQRAWWCGQVANAAFAGDFDASQQTVLELGDGPSKLPGIEPLGNPSFVTNFDVDKAAMGRQPYRDTLTNQETRINTGTREAFSDVALVSTLT